MSHNFALYFLSLAPVSCFPILPRLQQARSFGGRVKTQLYSSTSHEVDSLPIHDILTEITSSLKSKPNLILEAPPGAGKTTVVPLELLNHHDNIVVVEPRRVAARSAATRMALLLNEKVGETVGYIIRGESKISQKTRITVMTDGVLLQKLRRDQELERVNVVVLDEFHERGVGSDTALALCRESQKLIRDDLRIVVMSATLLGNANDEDSAANRLLHALGGEQDCQVLQSDGRQYPIKILWANQLSCWSGTSRLLPLSVLSKDRKALVETMSIAIEQGVARAPAQGDVLAFLPGAAEIRQTISLLKDRGNLNGIEVLPLYGALSREVQDAALFPSADSPRRIIVSSPIAEASLTLERVTCVVDSGLRREPRCDSDTGMPRLVTTRCSKASSTQRAGRAGRVREGLCIRIYNEVEFDEHFLEHAPPEIASTDLSYTLLLLLDWGCSSVDEIMNEIPFVDKPDEASLKNAISLLTNLKAIKVQDGRLSISEIGREIARFPTHPRFAANIVRAQDNVVELAGAVAAAFLMDDELGIRGNNNPDLAYRVRDLYEGNLASTRGLLRYATRISVPAKLAVENVLSGSADLAKVANALGRTLLPGFIDLVAERKGDASFGGSVYMLSLGRSARLDDIQTAPNYLVVADTSTSDDGKTRIRAFVPIDKDVLLNMAEERDTVFTVPSKGHEVRAKRVLAVGYLELSSTPLSAPSPEEATRVLKETIASLGGVYAALVQTLPPTKKQRVDELCSRVRFASASTGISEYPYFSALDAQASGFSCEQDRKILEELLDPWLATAGSLKKLDIYDILWGSLTHDQQRELDLDYPTKIEAPDGSNIPVSYAKEVPSASAKLQQFFGTTESPAVGPPQNRLTLSISLLSPSGKVLAETRDLPFFWKEAYPSVRAEMRGRYPKHPWPDNPLTAVASLQTKKQQASSSNGEKKNLNYDSSKKKKRGNKR